KGDAFVRPLSCTHLNFVQAGVGAYEIYKYPVDRIDDSNESEYHCTDGERESQSVGRTGSQRINEVDADLFFTDLEPAIDLFGLSFREYDFGNHDGCGSVDEGSAYKVAGEHGPLVRAVTSKEGNVCA